MYIYTILSEEPLDLESNVKLVVSRSEIVNGEPPEVYASLYLYCGVATLHSVFRRWFKKNNWDLDSFDQKKLTWTIN